MVEKSIGELYLEKSKALVRFCEVMLHHRMVNGIDAEDIVQKVVVKAWEKRQKLASHPNLLEWFGDACAKECLMLMRKEGYQHKAMGRAVPLSENMTMDEQADMIPRWLDHMEAVEFLAELKERLTPLERSVYEVYYLQEQTAKAAADALDIKVTAVNDAARRIRRRAAAMRKDALSLIL